LAFHPAAVLEGEGEVQGTQQVGRDHPWHT